MPALIALTEWGDRWAAPHGAPIRYEHIGCGGHVTSHLLCERCRTPIPPNAVNARPTDQMEAALIRHGRRPRPKK